MIGFGANLEAIAAEKAGALNAGWSSGASWECLFATRASAVPSEGPYPISCVRAGDTAMVVNRSGYLELVPAGTPRIHYNPVTLACRGLLIENEDRTNLETRSADYSNAAYTKVGLGSVTTNNAGAPDGTSTFNKLPEDGSTGLHTAVRNVTVVAGSTYVVSRFFKAAENSLVQLLFDDTATTNGVYANFNVSTGAITKAIAAFGTATAVEAGIESYGNGVYRAYIIGTAGTVATTARIAVTLLASGTSTPFPSYTGTIGNGLYVWGSDTQLGTSLMSHIPTTSAAVTRNKDVISVSNASGVLAGAITAQVEYELASMPTAAAVVMIDNGTANERISLRAGSALGGSPGSNDVVVTAGGVSQADTTGTVLALNTVHKSAFAIQANDLALYTNGAQGGTDASLTMPASLSRIALGESGFNGVIRRVSIFANTRQDNTYCAALTA